MRRRLGLTVAALTLAALAPSPAHAVATDVPDAPTTVHPRLVFSAQDVPVLRARIAGGLTVSGDQVAAAGDPANRYRVFAPQLVSSVVVNGGSASACRDGSHLRFPCER